MEDLTRSVRILHIIASVDPAWGGPVEGIIRQNEHQGQLGIREVVTLDRPDAPYLAFFPLKVYPTGRGHFANQRYSKISRFGFNFTLIPWLRKNLRNYDCVIVNGIWNFSSVAASIVLPKNKIPYFVFTHGMMDPWFKHKYPLKHILKHIFWVLFEGKLLAHANAVLFTTDEERLSARGQFIAHSYKEKVVGYGTSRVVGNVNAQIRTFQTSFPSTSGKQFILFLSRIHPKKGCDLLLEAFSRCCRNGTDLDLVIAGPDQNREAMKLKRYAELAGIASRVHWTGMLAGDEKWGAFHSAAAFILPSHQENFGIVVAEALACGRPVLLTNKVNIWREVLDAGAGLVEDDSAEGVESLINSFQQLSSAQRQTMGLNALKCFNDNFNIENTGRSLMSFIINTIEEKLP